MEKVFSEHFARSRNIFTAIDPRIKIIFSGAMVILILTSQVFYVGLLALALSVISLICIKIPWKVILLRMSEPLGIALTIMLIKIFFYHDQFLDALLLASKIFGSTSIMLFLSLTTSLDKLLAAACWFKAPRVWVEICLLTYRYIFVLWEDAATVMDSQKVRLGYCGIFRSLRSLGVLSGAIIIRAYDQSVATYEAMLSRGYNCLPSRLPAGRQGRQAKDKFG